MFRILESQAPAKQTATDTINTLTGRLQSATLLEDRRAAIQGLRSFAKIYPASVASGALRPLISSLRNDLEDVDTLKVVLETLLMLFSPDESSPEASDEIALWLSDEFTQRQDNITALLGLLDTRDFYSRLYSLQLIFQISSARPERTQECILTAPLGIPRLVSALSDAREPVRNEALLLLIALTPASEELQKLVAFENAFDLILSLIEKEGALSHGVEVVEDCLSLLANLLRLNTSNQSYFRETGCVKRLAKLLADVNYEQATDEPMPQWTLAHRDKNIWGLLVIVQLFLVRGGVNTPANQLAFWHSGVMEQVLSAAFSQKFSVNVTSKALATCADLIRGNQPLQERFGDVEVIWGARPIDGVTNGEAANKEPQRINVIEALLKLSLEPAPLQLLDARLAACECVKAFFANHNGIRVHVLGRAIDGHLSGQDVIPNILTALLTPPESRGNSDPYQTWMASVLMFHLLFENAKAKAIAMGVTEGDAENGEEVITCIQSIVGNLITGMQRGDDERISLGYLMLLCGWLFEEPDAVNDFLGEGSSIQSLLQEIKHRYVSNVLVSGLCTILLGIIYEFSSKDSPIPRTTLYKLLAEQMGREQYIDKITRFRESPMVRDFEVLPQTVGGQYESGLPEIFFDKTFVDFLKDNFGRMIRAIDREPELEISVITDGVERGVSRELVDSLKADLEERSQEIQNLRSSLVALQESFERERLEHGQTGDMTSKLQQINGSLQKELATLDEQLHAKHGQLQQYSEQLRSMENKLREATTESYRLKQQHETEVVNLQKRLRSLETELIRTNEKHAGEIADLKGTIQALQSSADKLGQDHAAEVSGLHGTIKKLEAVANESKKDVLSLNQTIQGLQSEVDSMKHTKQQHESEIVHLSSTNQTLRTELDAAKQKSGQDLQAVHDEYSSKCSSLEKRLEEAQGKVENNEAALRNSSEELAKTQKELEKVKLEAQKAEGVARDSAQAEVNEVRNELERVKSEVQATEASRKSAQAEVNEVRKELEKVKSEVQATEASRKSAQSEVEGLRKDLEKAKSDANKESEKAKSDAKKESEKARKSAQAELKGLQQELEKVKSKAQEQEAKARKASKNDSKAQKSTQELEGLREQLEKVKLEAKKHEEKALKAEASESEAQKSAKELEDLRKELETVRSEAKGQEEKARTASENESEAQESAQEIQELRKELEKVKSEAKEQEEKARKASENESEAKKSAQGLQELQKELEKVKLEAKQQEEKALEAAKEVDAQNTSQQLDSLRKELEKVKAEVKEKEEARQSAQSELEDLLIVFGDLEAKRNEDKKRLKNLGQEVSEAEDDDDEDDEDEDEE